MTGSIVGFTRLLSGSSRRSFSGMEGNVDLLSEVPHCPQKLAFDLLAKLHLVQMSLLIRLFPQ